MPNTRPRIIINKNGVCSACNFSHQKNKKIDWKIRRKKFLKLIQYKGNNNRYDCIIPVSGGKDSFRQAFYVRDKLKMNPLLVALTYPPEQYSERGPKNLSTLS